MTSASIALVRAVAQAVRARRPLRLTLKGLGAISVYPVERCYTTDLGSIERLPLVPETSITVSAEREPFTTLRMLPLWDLRWRVAHGQVRQLPRLGRSAIGPVRLRVWPDPREVPRELAPSVSRICAQLADWPQTPEALAGLTGMALSRVVLLVTVMQALEFLEPAGADQPPAP